MIFLRFPELVEGLSCSGHGFEKGHPFDKLREAVIFEGRVV